MKNELMLKGGLGNQLFQYAFAYSIQKLNNSPIIINKYFYLKAKDKRTLSLTELSIPNLRVKSWISSFICGTNYRIKRKVLFLKNRKRNDYKYFYKHRMIYNYNFGYFDVDDYISDNMVIDGHFQSKKYFDNYKEEIRIMFKCNKKLNLKNLELLEKIKNENAVCIHIRRGDFLLEKNKIFNICNKDYYFNAIKLIEEKISNPVFYIFSNNSDDLNWIKENYEFTKKMNFVDLHNSDVEELTLMSNFNYFIISNSTFSWWAQYLANSKLVIAPSRWLNNNEAWTELYDDSWLLINV